MPKIKKLLWWKRWVILGIILGTMGVANATEIIATNTDDNIATSSNIMGKVVNPVSGLPLADVTVVATTQTDILEEQKQSQIEVKTNKNGEFMIRGALP